METQAPPAPCTDRLLRLSGPIVCGRACGVWRCSASRCSRALPLGGDDNDGDEEEDGAVAAAAMANSKVEVKRAAGGGDLDE